MQPPIDFLSQPLYSRKLYSLNDTHPVKLKENKKKKIGVEKLNLRDNMFGK